MPLFLSEAFSFEAYKELYTSPRNTMVDIEVRGSLPRRAEILVLAKICYTSLLHGTVGFRHPLRIFFSSALKMVEELVVYACYQETELKNPESAVHMASV